MSEALKHLILAEPGVSKFFATAMDPISPEEARPMQRRLWKKFAELCGIDLSPDGPRKLLVEYPRGDRAVDILLLWDKWAILVECKIQSGAVRRGQLDGYYKLFHDRLGRDPELSGAERLAVVMASPGDIGQQEFDSLRVGEGDHKAKVRWEDLFEAIERFYVTDSAGMSQVQFFLALMCEGLRRCRQVVEEAGRHEGHPENRTPNRQRCQGLLRTVMALIPDKLSETFRFKAGGVYVGNDCDLLYGDLGKDNTGNVNLKLLVGSEVGEEGLSELKVGLSFKVADKAPSEMRREAKRAFGALKGEEQELMADLELQDAKVEIDDHRREVMMRFNRQGTRDEMADQLAELFCKMARRFRPFLRLEESVQET